MALKAYKLWSIVNVTKTRPTIETEKEIEGSYGTAEDKVRWQEQGDQAEAVIMFSVLAHDLTTVTDAASAQDAWQALKGFYDPETINTTTHLPQNVTERKLSDGASPQDHLTEFHNDWIRLKDRSQQGRGEPTSAHCPKRRKSRISPHISTIFNGQHRRQPTDKRKVTYEDVRARLLDISASKSVTTGNSKTAYRVQRSGDRSRSPGSEEKSVVGARKGKCGSVGTPRMGIGS